MSVTNILGKVRQNPRGAWSSSATYTYLDTVNDPVSGSAYMALGDVPAGTSLTNTAYWMLLVNGVPVGDVTDAVNDWLDAHPEATTTVEDGSITTAKLADGAVTDVKLAQSGGVLEAVGYGDIMTIPIQKQGGLINTDGTISLDPTQTYYFISQKIDVTHSSKIRVSNYYRAATRPTVTILDSSGSSVATLVNPAAGLPYVELLIPSTGVSAYVQATSSLTPVISLYASFEKISSDIISERERVNTYSNGFGWYELVEENNLSGAHSNATSGFKRNGTALSGYVTKIYDVTNIEKCRFSGSPFRVFGKKASGEMSVIINTSVTNEIFDTSEYVKIIVCGLQASFWGSNYNKLEGYTRISSKWRNRKIVWFGTSIPAGGFKGEDNPLSYPFQVGRKLGATVYNEAVGDSGVHYRELNKVSATNPYGFNFYFVSASRCLTNTIAMMQWIGNWADYYCNGGTYKNPEEWDSTIFTSGLPSTWTDADTEAIKQFSYENKLDKYLTDDTCPDLFVFDHGYNDRIRWADNTGTYEAQLAEYGRDNCYTFRGAMNFLIDRIYTFKPTAKIVLIGDYEAQSDEKKYDSIYQQRVADDYEIPIFKRWEKTGWSQVQETMNAAWDSGLLTVKSTSATKTLLAWNLADGVHPHSDKTGGAIRLMADLITPFIDSI